MKRFVLAAAIVGIAAFARPTFAEPPHGNVYFAGHHHHSGPYYGPPVVRYYPPRARYYAPVVVAPPVCAPPVAYGAYYPPAPVNTFSVGGRNFGLNFTW
jgi:hypothetical protein